jgi:hypothetical protein
MLYQKSNYYILIYYMNKKNSHIYIYMNLEYKQKYLKYKKKYLNLKLELEGGKKKEIEKQNYHIYHRFKDEKIKKIDRTDYPVNNRYVSYLDKYNNLIDDSKINITKLTLGENEFNEDGLKEFVNATFEYLEMKYGGRFDKGGVFRKNKHLKKNGEYKPHTHGFMGLTKYNQYTHKLESWKKEDIEANKIIPAPELLVNDDTIFDHKDFYRDTFLLAVTPFNHAFYHAKSKLTPGKRSEIQEKMRMIMINQIIERLDLKTKPKNTNEWLQFLKTQETSTGTYDPNIKYITDVSLTNIYGGLFYDKSFKEWSDAFVTKEEVDNDKNKAEEIKKKEEAHKIYLEKMAKKKQIEQIKDLAEYHKKNYNNNLKKLINGPYADLMEWAKNTQNKEFGFKAQLIMGTITGIYDEYDKIANAKVEMNTEQNTKAQHGYIQNFAFTNGKLHPDYFKYPNYMLANEKVEKKLAEMNDKLKEMRNSHHVAEIVNIPKMNEKTKLLEPVPYKIISRQIVKDSNNKDIIKFGLWKGKLLPADSQERIDKISEKQVIKGLLERGQHYFLINHTDFEGKYDLELSKDEDYKKMASMIELEEEGQGYYSEIVGAKLKVPNEAKKFRTLGESFKKKIEFMDSDDLEKQTKEMSDFMNNHEYPTIWKDSTHKDAQKTRKGFSLTEIKKWASYIGKLNYYEKLSPEDKKKVISKYDQKLEEEDAWRKNAAKRLEVKKFRAKIYDEEDKKCSKHRRNTRVGKPDYFAFSVGPGDDPDGLSKEWKGECHTPTYCFNPLTKIELADGRTKLIKDIRLDDKLKNGSIVEGTLRLRNPSKEPYYRIKNNENGEYILVTGKHKVLKQNKEDVFDNYVYIKDYKFAEVTDIIDETVINLITSDHRIQIGEHKFWDWEDGEENSLHQK